MLYHDNLADNRVRSADVVADLQFCCRFPSAFTMSVFSAVPAAPAIEVFKLTRDFQADADENKVNFQCGIFIYVNFLQKS